MVLPETIHGERNGKQKLHIFLLPCKMENFFFFPVNWNEVTVKLLPFHRASSNKNVRSMLLLATQTNQFIFKLMQKIAILIPPNSCTSVYLKDTWYVSGEWMWVSNFHCKYLPSTLNQIISTEYWIAKSSDFFCSSFAATNPDRFHTQVYFFPERSIAMKVLFFDGFYMISHSILCFAKFHTIHAHEHLWFSTMVLDHFSFPVHLLAVLSIIHATLWTKKI